MTQLVLNERRRKENVLDDRIRVVGEFIFRIQEVVGNQGFQRMDLQFGKCPSNDGISDPLSYKFEIGRGRGANRNGGCGSLKFLKPARGEGRGRNFLDDRSRDSTRGGRILIGRSQLVGKIGFHRWWPGRIIPGPRLPSPWTRRNKRFNGQSFGH